VFINNVGMISITIG